MKKTHCITPTTKTKNNTWRFLQELLCQHVVEQNKTSLSIPLESIDIALLWQLLNEHRATLIAYQILKNPLPPDHFLLQKLKSHSMILVQSELKKQKMLKTLIDYFQQQSLSYVVLKGTPLNQLLYGTQLCRSSCDIDLLIDPKNFIQAHKALRNIGFVLATPELEEALLNNTKVALAICKDFGYRHKEDNILLELHHRTNKLPELSIALSQLETFSYIILEKSNQKITILNPEENFLYLCFHAAKHNWGRLQWLVDLAVFYQHQPINWLALCVLAKKRQQTRALLEAKALLKEWFSITLPDIPHAPVDSFCIKLRLHYVRRMWHEKNIDPSSKKSNPFLNLFTVSLLCPNFSTLLAYFPNHLLQSKKSINELIKKPLQSKTKLLITVLLKSVFPFYTHYT